MLFLYTYFIFFIFFNYSSSHKLSVNSVISEYISPEIIDEIRKVLLIVQFLKKPLNFFNKKTSNGLGSQLFCNGKGKFLDGICECYKGFAGEKCQVALIKNSLFVDKNSFQIRRWWITFAI